MLPSQVQVIKEPSFGNAMKQKGSSGKHNTGIKVKVSIIICDGGWILEMYVPVHIRALNI